MNPAAKGPPSPEGGCSPLPEGTSAPPRAQDPAREEPRRVEIHLGASCNNRCVFCMSGIPRDQKEPWAPFERVKAELEHFYARGCRAVGFLGGEPSVYPRIVESVACAKGLGYARISICTNGTVLSNVAFCRRLVEAGLTRVTLSVHSRKPEIEDRLITGVPGNFARKVAAVRNLVSLRSQGRLPGNLSLNPVLCRPTLWDMEGFIGFFGDLGVDDIRFNYIWPMGEVGKDRRWIPSFREAMPEMARIMLVNERRLRRHLTFGGVPKCALGLARISGRVLDYLAAKYLDEAGYDPPNDVSMADQRGRLEDRFVWQETKRNLLKTMSPVCRGCRYHAGCDGVWRSYADLYGLEELKPL